MKSFITLACALLLLGCSNDSTSTKTPSSIPEATTAQTTPEIGLENNVSKEATLQTPVATQAVEKAPVNASVDASTLFAQKCASCHGAKGEKSALNKSQIIASFSEAQIKDALKGYQGGTYGKELKAVMQGQAKGLNDAQIDALAKSISSF